MYLDSVLTLISCLLSTISVHKKAEVRKKTLKILLRVLKAWIAQYIDIEFVNNRDIKYHECPYCVYSTHMIIF